MKKIILAASIVFTIASCTDNEVANGPVSNDTMPSETTTGPDGTTNSSVISRDTSAMSVDNTGNVDGGDSSVHN